MSDVALVKLESLAKEKERPETNRELAVSAPGKSSESVKLSRGQWPSTGLHDTQLSLDRTIPPTLLGIFHFTGVIPNRLILISDLKGKVML